MNDRLALHGGPKTVTLTEAMKAANRWPNISELEKAAVLEAMSGSDPYQPIPQLEKEFAEWIGATYALAQNNGSSTLQSAYFAVGVEPGDEVICPAFTWHLSVSQILTLHAIPVFCDIDPVTACIDPEDIRRKITPQTKAINVLHPFGAVAPMDEIMAIARERNLPVIEDCSHAHGARYKGRLVGSIGDIGCFSLQAGKLLTAIEGGLMVTNNQEYYERAILLGHYERVPHLKLEKYRKYYPPYPNAPTSFGYKYRMHPWAAACALVQLHRLDELNGYRRHNLEFITRGLQAIDSALQPIPETPGTERTWLNYICHYFPERLGGISRERFVEALLAEGVPASAGRVGYVPVYWNPLYTERNMWAEGIPFDGPAVKRKVIYQTGDCPEAERIWQRTVGLPSFPNVCPEALLEQTVDAIRKVVCRKDDLLE